MVKDGREGGDVMGRAAREEGEDGGGAGQCGEPRAIGGLWLKCLLIP